MTDLAALKVAFGHVTNASFWKATKGLGKGYAIADPGEAAKLVAYVNGLTAGINPPVPTMATEHGKGLLGIIQAGLASSPVPPPPLAESADKTTVPPAAQIVDAHGDRWTITGGKVAKNGTADPITSGVVELAYVGRVLWQKNSAGSWYAWMGTSWGPATTQDPTVAPIPVPASGVPAQGFTVPLPNFAAHTTFLMNEIATALNGKKGFFRTDGWRSDPAWAPMKAAADARGFTIMAIHNPDYRYLPTITQFASDAAQLALEVAWVDLFNEPDNPAWPGRWPADVAGRYAGAAYAAIKRANPNCQVSGPSLSMNLGVDGCLAYHDAFFTAGGMVDYPSFHIYGDVLDTGWAANPYSRWSDFQAVFQKHLGHAKIILTEAGNSALQHGDAYQTSSVANGMDARDRLGIVAFIDYSMMEDAEPGGFGKLRGDLTERDAFGAFKARAK